ncbi:Helicase C-terminal [Penicillium concentricum]|uniref:Helicase C-terminal n=1 Tax=Penicillium concentricum TaxID=293559 RepID=A0A9W9USM2_9EURO|nr:Helicase C-terminal [Penicillium concentricum]KAJ5355842.1 Helicase C-terminal [Penicillium concentricum]
MQHSGEMHKIRVPEVAHSQPKLSNGHLTFRPTEGTQYVPQDTVYPAAQSPSNDQSTSVELTRPRIKKEFPDENAQVIKTWDKFRLVPIKQEPNTRQEPGIKMEPQEFNDDQRVQPRHVIDLTDEDNSSIRKCPRPRMELLMAVHQYQKAAEKAAQTVEPPVETLFVQDDNSSPSTPNASEFLEPGEDDISEFNGYQKQFRSLQSPSMEQQVEFEKRRQEELERRRKVKLDKLCDLNVQAELEETESENIPSSGVEEQPQPKELQPQEQTKAELKKPITVRPPGTRLSKSKMQKAKELGLAQLLSKEGARKHGKASETEPEPEQNSGTKGKEKQYRRPPTVLSTEEVRSIFSNDDSCKKGKDPLPPGFVSTEKNKQKAFKEMLASIPVAEKAGARADISLLDEATRTFNPSARSDGQGKWKVRGLQTSLMVNQILAASWMCKRETSLSKPNGGLLCDVMGFGKTLSALACIVNRKIPSQPEGPTLIIAPRNLIQTWMSQIRQHCNRGAAGSVIAHCSGARVETDDLAHHLKQHGIVLTTYQEISSSYPDLKPSPGFRTDDSIKEWWNQEYGKIGVFHQINWHRIILDEAHIIRNRTTRTSIAVRALSGNFKWALTGTPLHNSVDELYSLFAFIEVPNSHPYHVFMHNFCDGSNDAKDRLINMLRAVIHRKTHESRHMGRPLIELKRFGLKEVKVDFYPVERQIYNAITERFIERVNASRKKSQSKCILTMILKLQMFTSHPLAGEDYLKRVCNFNNTLDAQLKTWVKDETSTGPSPSSRIAKCCLSGRYQTNMPMAPLRSRTESENLRPRPPGNCAKLVSKFKAKIEALWKEKDFYESDHRTWFCPGCEGLPTRAIITDCQHLYCEECFDALDDEEGNTDGVSRQCRTCKIAIKKAALYGIYDDFDTPPLEDAEFSELAGQQKRPATSETTRTANEGRTKKRRKDKYPGSTFSEWLLADETLSAFDNESERGSQDEVRDKTPDEDDVPCEKEEVDQGQDWIAKFGRSMPGAKFDAITVQVKEWLEKDSTAKIVIFTQYINSNRLLRYLCEENGWKCSQMTGRMANRSREINLSNFRDDDETKIMIASIKTGGLGLDFSVANKCILVDLWWNEAVQDQAFFRLWRLGQQRDVECIMLMVKDSIDDWMDKTQKRKAKEIGEVMSQNVLMDRNTLKELLEMFGEVTEDPKKGFAVHLQSKNASNSAPKASAKGKVTRSAPPKKQN